MRTTALLLLLVSPSLAQLLLIGEKAAHSVGFYNAADGKQIARVPTGKHPHEIALSPDGAYAYVTDNGMLWMTDPGEGGNTITVIDVRRRTRAKTIDLGKYHRPHGIDIDAGARRLAVTVENPDGLLLIDPAAGKVLRAYDVKGQAPHMVRLDPKGEWAYVSNTRNAALAAVNLVSGEVKLIPVGARPQGAVIDRAGKTLYVTNSDGNSISIVDLAARRTTGTIPVGRGPGRIAITPDGRQLVYNLQAGSAVGFADIAGRRQLAVVPLPGPPLSLHLSRDGAMAYAGVQSLDRICVISVKERRIVRTFDTSKGAGPDAVVELPQ
jgi:YVTN family beta-propeller protein